MSFNLRFFYFLLSLFFCFGWVSCTPDEAFDEEIITTVHLNVSGIGLFVARQGSIGDTIRLQAESQYQVNLEFFNENVSPPDNITQEIQTEDFEHLVCYDLIGIPDLEIISTDSDGVYPVGIETSWIAMGVSKGDVFIRLRHQPDIKDGTCNIGTSDIEVTFPVKIQ